MTNGINSQSREEINSHRLQSKWTRTLLVNETIDNCTFDY